MGAAASAFLFVVWAAPGLGLLGAGAGSVMLAFATPLLFYGVTVWEHSIALALVLAAWALLSRRRWPSTALAGALIAAGCVLRSELAIVGIAAATALLLVRGGRGTIALAIGAAPVAVALLVLHVLVYGSPLGPHVTNTVIPDWNVGGAGWMRSIPGLIVGFGTTSVEAVGFAACGIVLVALAVVAAVAPARVGSWIAIASATVAAVAWGIGLGRILSADDPIAVLARYNGLVLQVPLCALAGIGMVRAWRMPDFEPVRVALVASVVFVVCAVCIGAATKYSSGIHWGPRFLLPAVPMVVLSALLAARSGGTGVRAAFALLAVASLSSSGAAVWLLSEQTREGQRLADVLLAARGPVVLTTHPLMPQQLAPLWDRKPMLLVRDPQDLPTMVRNLERGGADSFVFAVAPGARWDALARVRCAKHAEQRGRRIHYLDMDVWTCEIRPAG